MSSPHGSSEQPSIITTATLEGTLSRENKTQTAKGCLSMKLLSNSSPFLKSSQSCSRGSLAAYPTDLPTPPTPPDIRPANFSLWFISAPQIPVGLYVMEKTRRFVRTAQKIT